MYAPPHLNIPKQGYLQVSMAATTREFLIMARHNLIPGWLAVVHPSLGTPYRVIIAYGVVKCARSLLKQETPMPFGNGHRTCGNVAECTSPHSKLNLILASPFRFC